MIEKGNEIEERGSGSLKKIEEEIIGIDKDCEGIVEGEGKVMRKKIRIDDIFVGIGSIVGNGRSFIIRIVRVWIGVDRKREIMEIWRRLIEMRLRIERRRRKGRRGG